MTDMVNYLGHLIRRLHQQSTAIFADEMARAGYDVTPMQFAALTGILHHEQIDQAGLADFVACDRATMGGIIDRLEKKGLVRRQVSSTDRRARVLSLTGQGRALIDEIQPIVQSMQGKIGGQLSHSDRDALAQLINRALFGGNR